MKLMSPVRSVPKFTAKLINWERLEEYREPSKQQVQIELNSVRKNTSDPTATQHLDNAQNFLDQENLLAANYHVQLAKKNK